MGGSNAVGLWGYLEMVRELLQQQAQAKQHYDHIVMACGSGGTASGIALGLKLVQLHQERQQREKGDGGDGANISLAKVHGVCVCDDPDFFYDHMREVVTASGLRMSVDQPGSSNSLGDPTEWIALYQGKGKGCVVHVL